MKKSLVTLAVATTLTMSAFAAQAEDMYRGAWYALPGVSYMDADESMGSKENGGGVFLKLGKELSQSWDIQGGLGYNRASRSTTDTSGTGKYKQTTLGLDALYMFSRDNFRPFLLAGVGVARNNLDYKYDPANTTSFDGKKTSWLANVGLGAQYLINDTFGLQADLRRQWSRAKHNSVGNGVPNENISGTLGNNLLSLGGIFRFGAPAAAPAVESAPVAEPVAAAPMQEPMAAPAPVAEACKPTLETVTVSAEHLFAFDKAGLKAEGKAELDAIGEKIKADSNLTLVLVTGHTDRIGSDAYNQKLSERRANQVKEYLVSQGIDASRLQADGKGESQPVVECGGVKGKKAVECLAPNRRVVISAGESREVGCK